MKLKNRYGRKGVASTWERPQVHSGAGNINSYFEYR